MRLAVAVATAAFFTGAFSALAPHAVASLTTAPDGGWTQVIEPRAIEHEGVLYFGLIDGDDGDVKVGSFDGTTTTLTTVGTAPQVDTHDAPVIHIRSSDERLMVFWSGHVTADMFLRVSTNPLDVSSWGSEVNLDSQLGGHFYTYPNILELDNGDLYLIYRDHAGNGPSDFSRMAFSKSTDDGVTWAAQTLVLEQANRDPYWTVSTDGTRIDVATSDGFPLTSLDAAIRHLYYDGSTWRSADGTSLGSPPFDAIDLPLVATGPGWPHGVITTDGPVIAYTIDDTTTTFNVATWNGSSWVLSELEDAGALVSSSDPSDMTLFDANTAYGGVKVGGFYELHRYRRVHGGWSITHVTEGSAVDNIYPARIHGGTTRKVVWLRGTYTTFLDTDLAVAAGR